MRAIVEPGSIMFSGQRIRLTLMLEESAAAESRAGAELRGVPAVGPGYRTHHETTLRIRVVA